MTEGVNSVVRLSLSHARKICLKYEAVASVLGSISQIPYPDYGNRVRTNYKAFNHIHTGLNIMPASLNPCHCPLHQW
jgi:hypothetical protein